eukprot:809229-Amphidinium_carterae.1
MTRAALMYNLPSYVRHHTHAMHLRNSSKSYKRFSYVGRVALKVMLLPGPKRCCTGCRLGKLPSTIFSVDVSNYSIRNSRPCN